MTRTPKGLILDFGGVVTSDVHGSLSAFCIREGLLADAAALAIADPDGQAALCSAAVGATPQRAWEVTFGRLLGVDDSGLIARALADLRACDPVLELVARARAAGVRTAILSNSWGSGDYDPYDGYDLEQRFDTVVKSDQVGLRKPDPAIYRLTTEQLGVEPPDCVFVDDTLHNLEPATALGMAVVGFNGDVASRLAEIERALGLTGWRSASSARSPRQRQ